MRCSYSALFSIYSIVLLLLRNCVYIFYIFYIYINGRVGCVALSIRVHVDCLNMNAGLGHCAVVTEKLIFHNIVYITTN